MGDNGDLERLQRLHDEGLLSEAEFTTARKRLDETASLPPSADESDPVTVPPEGGSENPLRLRRLSLVLGAAAIVVLALGAALVIGLDRGGDEADLLSATSEGTGSPSPSSAEKEPSPTPSAQPASAGSQSPAETTSEASAVVGDVTVSDFAAETPGLEDFISNAVGLLEAWLADDRAATTAVATGAAVDALWSGLPSDGRGADIEITDCFTSASVGSTYCNFTTSDVSGVDGTLFSVQDERYPMIGDAEVSTEAPIADALVIEDETGDVRQINIHNDDEPVVNHPGVDIQTATVAPGEDGGLSMTVHLSERPAWSSEGQGQSGGWHVRWRLTRSPGDVSGGQAWTGFAYHEPDTDGLQVAFEGPDGQPCGGASAYLGDNPGVVLDVPADCLPDYEARDLYVRVDVLEGSPSGDTAAVDDAPADDEDAAGPIGSS